MAVSTAPTVNQQKDLASFRAGKESSSDSVMWHTLPLEEAFAQGDKQSARLPHHCRADMLSDIDRTVSFGGGVVDVQFKVFNVYPIQQIVPRIPARPFA